MTITGFRPLPVTVSLAFSFLAITFSLLATTSHTWAKRDYYDSVIPERWTHPNYTISRSPFFICSARPNFVTVNGSLPDDEPTLSLANYTISCDNYRPYGTNRTSCELRSVTKNDSIVTDGDSRLCQQIHLAGNFAISGSVFISTGFLLYLLLGGFTLSRLLAGPSSKMSSSGAQAAAESGNKRETSEMVDTAQREPRAHRKRVRSYTSFLNLTASISLYLGAILSLIAQFYGILGLVQSAPNNADWASSSAGNSKNVDTDVVGYHGPWYQGNALSVYFTCAWAFALAATVVASRTWSMPAWTVMH